MTVPDEVLMDTAEVARYLKMHPKTITNMAERGELKAYKVGRHWRYRKGDIDVFLEQRQNIPSITKEDETQTSQNSDDR